MNDLAVRRSNSEIGESTCRAAAASLARSGEQGGEDSRDDPEERHFR